MVSDGTQIFVKDGIIVNEVKCHPRSRNGIWILNQAKVQGRDLDTRHNIRERRKPPLKPRSLMRKTILKKAKSRDMPTPKTLDKGTVPIRYNYDQLKDGVVQILDEPIWKRNLSFMLKV